MMTMLRFWALSIHVLIYLVLVSGQDTFLHKSNHSIDIAVGELERLVFVEET